MRRLKIPKKVLVKKVPKKVRLVKEMVEKSVDGLSEIDWETMTDQQAMEEYKAMSTVLMNKCFDAGYRDAVNTINLN